MGTVMRMRKAGTMAAVNVTVIMDGKCVLWSPALYLTVEIPPYIQDSAAHLVQVLFINLFCIIKCILFVCVLWDFCSQSSCKCSLFSLDRAESSCIKSFYSVHERRVPLTEGILQPISYNLKGDIKQNILRIDNQYYSCLLDELIAINLPCK